MTFTQFSTQISDKSILLDAVDRQDINDFKEIAKKWTVFSFGVNLYYDLTGNIFPYPRNEGGELQANLNYSEIAREDIPPELKGLIHDMLAPNYQNRITGQEAKRRFDEIVETQFPDLAAQIRRNKEFLGYRT